jgi:hypothetical protein
MALAVGALAGFGSSIARATTVSLQLALTDDAADSNYSAGKFAYTVSTIVKGTPMDLDVRDGDGFAIYNFSDPKLASASFTGNSGIFAGMTNSSVTFFANASSNSIDSVDKLTAGSNGPPPVPASPSTFQTLVNTNASNAATSGNPYTNSGNVTVEFTGITATAVSAGDTSTATLILYSSDGFSTGSVYGSLADGDSAGYANDANGGTITVASPTLNHNVTPLPSAFGGIAVLLSLVGVSRLATRRNRSA